MRVFIDGENFRHRIVGALLHEGLISDVEDQFNFDLRGLVDGALGGDPAQEINYYTSRVKQPDFEIPEELRERIDSIQKVSHQWTTNLTEQGIQVIEGGNLKVHDSARCIHCHLKTLVLQEKGVDVRIATDIVLAATIEEMEHVIVASSDSDMIPALDVAKRASTRITYLCFEEDLNHSISNLADETRTFSRQDIVNYFQANNK